MSRRTLRTFLAPAALLWGASIVAGHTWAAAQGGVDFAPLTANLSSRRLIRVLDTESSLGPMSRTPQTVTLADLVRFHGHPCDGLIAAAEGITLGLKALFPEGIVDRTDVAAATNASPCYSDVAAYLTGARTLYGTLVIDRSLGDEWILERRSTGKAVMVRLKPGVKPAGLPAMEKRLRNAGCDGPLIAQVQALQLTFIHRLFSAPPGSLYEVTELPVFPYSVTGERPDAAEARCGDSGR